MRAPVTADEPGSRVVTNSTVLGFRRSRAPSPQPPHRRRRRPLSFSSGMPSCLTGVKPGSVAAVSELPGESAVQGPGTDATPGLRTIHVGVTPRTQPLREEAQPWASLFGRDDARQLLPRWSPASLRGAKPPFTPLNWNSLVLVDPEVQCPRHRLRLAVAQASVRQQS